MSLLQTVKRWKAKLILTIRQKLATHYVLRREYHKACRARGYHIGLKQTGRCLACGKVEPKHLPEHIQRRLNTPRRVETIPQHNARVRREARLYGA